MTTSNRPARFLTVCLVFAAALTVPSLLSAAEVPEEITVTDATLKNLRADLYQAEDRMYGIFNTLIEDDDFRIVCHDVALTGSLIKHRVCEPNFMYRAKVKDYRDARDGGPDRIRYIRNSGQLNKDLAAKSEAMKQRMAELAQEHPDLLGAINEVVRLRNEILSKGGEP